MTPYDLLFHSSLDLAFLILLQDVMYLSAGMHASRTVSWIGCPSWPDVLRISDDLLERSIGCVPHLLTTQRGGIDGAEQVECDVRHCEASREAGCTARGPKLQD